jgi:hypothetical protein
MIVKPFSQKIDPEKVFEIQNFQYQERLLMSDTIGAGTTRLGRVAVSNIGHFFCQKITGTFTSLAIAGDTGFDYLSGQLVDGAGNRKLYNDRIPFSLWLTPGRRRSTAGGTAGNSLFLPIEFEYLFTANSEIQLDVANTSDAANQYEICFHGIRIISDMVVRNRISNSGNGAQVRRSAYQPNRRG